jgi:hypothetical protein
VLEAQMLDELVAALAVRVVELVADLALTVRTFFEKSKSAWWTQDARQQPAVLEKAVELAKHVQIAEILQAELLKGDRGLVAMIEPKAHEIAHYPPRAFRELFEIVPALLDGSAAVELVPVQIGARVFQFDDGDGAGYVPRENSPSAPSAVPMPGTVKLRSRWYFAGLCVAVL